MIYDENTFSIIISSTLVNNSQNSLLYFFYKMRVFSLEISEALNVIFIT